jgi:hypothetical protein
MSELLNRRRAIAAALALPAAAAVLAAGCSGGEPNQFVSGTLAKPLDAIEDRDEKTGKRRGERDPRKAKKK